MKKIFLWGAVLCLAGCGRVSVERYADYFPEKNITVEVKVDEAVTSWWGPVKSEVKDKIIETIKEEFRESPLSLVKEKADISVILRDIVTVGAADRIQIEEVILSAMSDKGEIFKLRYKQKPTRFPDDWYKLWTYAKCPEWIAQILAGKIVYELGIRRFFVRSEMPVDKQRPAQRGYIIYRPQKD